MKKTFYTEATYVSGIIILAIGTAFMERADFGMSMVVAPAYILHLKISEYFEFFSFGMSEYLLQAVLLTVLAVIKRRVKISYLFSFVTAVIYGFVLDGAISLISFMSFGDATAFRIICFAVGILLCTIGVSLLFHTYISPEAYELFVTEISAKVNMSVSKFKTIYDLASLIISVILSFVFFGFGHFEGIYWGTVICTFLNGWLIGRWSFLFERGFEFKDGLMLRRYFEK